MIFGDPTQSLISLIGRLSNGATRQEIAKAIKVCTDAKPDGYDETVAGARDRYIGNGSHFTRRKLQQRYARSGGKIPAVTTNWLYMMACNDATVYANGVVRNFGEQSQEAMEQVLKGAGFSEAMVELEKRVQACGAQWMSFGYDKMLDRVCVNLHWPDTVHAIAHHSHPTELDYCYMLIASVSGPTSAQWYDLWVRDFAEDASGNVESFGKWKRHRVSDKGEALYGANDPLADYIGDKLPWCIATKGKPDGSLYPMPDKDMLDQIDDINALASDQQYVLGLQGHTPVVYKGTGVKGVENLSFGPDTVLDGKQGDFTTLSLNPKLLEMRQAREQRVQELAISHRQPADAYNPQGAPLSGASRRIANIPAERQRQEMAEYYEHFEEHFALPVIANVANVFGGAGISEPIEASVEFNPPSEYEDSATVQRKLIEAKDAGLISPARCAVDSGYYKTLADAVEAGLSDKAQTVDPMANSNIPLFSPSNFGA